MIIAQLSDLHLRPRGAPYANRIDPESNVRRAFQMVSRLQPAADVLLLTGDLVDAGGMAEYEVLQELLREVRIPTYLIPGNHDDRAHLFASFFDHDYLPRTGDFLHYTVEQYPVRLIGLDTVVPRQGGGLLCPERLAWLDQRLREQPTTPTLIFMHHPPFATGIEHMDAMGLANGVEFAALLAPHKQVQRVVCGHVHRHVHTTLGGAHIVICPSAVHQIELNLTPSAVGAYTLEPPGCLLHVWAGGTMLTHLVPIGDFAGPFRFA